MNHIVLFEPEKPAHVGNIIRTCMCLGADLVVVGYTSFDISDKSLKRAGMDYLSGVNITKYDTFDEFFANTSGEYRFVTRYSKKVYSEFDLSDNNKDYYLLFGRESTGLPHDLLRKNFEKTMRIPMVANARSLNLANSVAIVLSEAIRQQGFNNLATSEQIKGEDFLFEEDKKS